MPDIANAFPSKYLKASDLQGGEPVVTLDHVAFEAVGQDRQQKAVLYFKGKEKGLVLNKTNANKITALLGTGVTEEWEGRKVRLYATETQFAGDTVDCIRIKAATNGARPAPPPPPPSHEAELEDDQIPF